MTIIRTTLTATLLLAPVHVASAQEKSAAAKDKAPASQPASAPASAVPVDFEKLKALFPETLEAKGENDEVEKVKITRASARYAGKDLNSSANLRIEVHVADHGAEVATPQTCGARSSAPAWRRTRRR